MDYVVDDAFKKEYTGLVRKVGNIKAGPGIEVTNTSNGIVISASGGRNSLSFPTPANTDGLINVWLTRVGGSNGSSSAFPTYTYDVYTDAAKTKKIGTAKLPLWHLIKSELADNVNIKGLARKTEDTCVLEIAYEVFASSDCAVPTGATNFFSY